MTMKTTITRSGANWPLVEAGAPCAQAGGINEFMHSPCRDSPPAIAAGSEKPPLCHSVRRCPPGQIRRGEGCRPALGNRLPQGTHQAEVEGKIVHGIQPAAQNLVAPVEMPQVR